MIDIDVTLDALIKQDRAGLIEKIKESALFGDLLEDYVHNDDVRSIEAEFDHLSTISYSLYEAICEGRKDDAIYLLSQMFDEHFNDSATYAKLFPDRVK